MFAIFGALLALAAVRLVWVQVIDGPRLAEQALSQRSSTVEIEPKRGTIYDREGQTLAVSVASYDVFVDPSLFPSDDASAVATFLAPRLNLDEAELGAKIAEVQAKAGRYVRIAQGVTPDVRDAIKKATKRADGDSESTAEFKSTLRRCVGFALEYGRAYPAGEVGAQIVGFVGGENRGSAGLELQYESVLAGKAGLVIGERDTAGNEIPTGEQYVVEPTAGSDLVLTIDLDIQYKAQEELAAAVDRYKATSGSVIVMNPTNGEIYASASYPYFDANSYGDADPNAFHNRAFTDAYEPGSTFKCLSIAGALQTGAVTPSTEFTVPYTIKVGTRKVSDHEWHKTEVMSVSDIIAISSNVGTTFIAQKMGASALHEQLVKFGIGTSTGLDYPTSAKGLLAPTSSWSDVSLSNISFGQGVSVTPIQLARAIASIANGGLASTPHLLRAVPSNPSLNPKLTTTRVVNTKTADEMTAMLREVMTTGTGADIDVAGYSLAGKTGTAQKAVSGKGYVSGKYVGSFVGFLPADDPQLLVLVVLDEPKAGYYGGYVSEIAFENIATFAAAHLGIAPDVTESAEPAKQPTSQDGTHPND